MREALKADRLEAVLSGSASPDDLSRDLARLVTLAEQVNEAIEIPPLSDAFRTRLRSQLLEAPGPSVQGTLADAAATGHPAGILQRLRSSARAKAAAAVASTLIGTTGVAAAAQEALPGDLLYPVKGFTEDARLLFSSNVVERGHLHLQFARERLEELERGVGRLGPDSLRATFTALDEEASQGANLLLGADPTPQTAEALTAFTGEIQSRLQEVQTRLPLSVRDSAERTLEVLRRINLQVTALTEPIRCAECDATAAGDDVLSVPQVVLPGDGPARTPCGCVGGAPVLPDVGTTPEDNPSGVGEVDAPDDGDFDEPSDDGNGGSLTGSVGNTTSGVGSLLDDLLQDDLGGSLETTVDDVVSEVDDVAPEVTGTITDLLGDD